MRFAINRTTVIVAATALLAIAGLSVSASVASASECPPDTASGSFWPVVKVKLQIPKVQYVTTLTPSQLARQSHEADLTETITGGMFASNSPPALELRGTLRSIRNTDGRFCVWAEQIDATFMVKRMTIYIANIYRPGSCNYNVVLAHEQHHMEDYLDLIDSYTREVERALGSFSIPTRFQPLLVSSPQEGQHQAEALLKETQTRLMEDFQRDYIEISAKFHASETPEAVSGRCPSWQ